jgi:hypothetical protein
MMGRSSRLLKNAAYLPARLVTNYQLISVKWALSYESLTGLPSSRVYGHVTCDAFEEGISLEGRRKRKTRKYQFDCLGSRCMSSLS